MYTNAKHFLLQKKKSFSFPFYHHQHFFSFFTIASIREPSVAKPKQNKNVIDTCLKIERQEKKNNKNEDDDEEDEDQQKRKYPVCGGSDPTTSMPFFLTGRFD